MTVFYVLIFETYQICFIMLNQKQRFDKKLGLIICLHFCETRILSYWKIPYYE